MCVAILVLPGHEPSLEKLDEGARCNKDGSGYAYVDETDTVRIRRSLNWSNLRAQFISDIEKYGDRSPFLVHHRIKSHGVINKDNCHPFRMADGGAFIHNGMIDIYSIPDEVSDTRWFVSHVIDQLPRGWERDIVWCGMVENMIGRTSKAVGLWPDRAYFIFNESAGHWEDDTHNRLYGKYEETKTKRAIWYSNASCNIPSNFSNVKTVTPHSQTAAGGGMTTGGGSRFPLLGPGQRAQTSNWMEKPLPPGFDKARWRRTADNTIELIPLNERGEEPRAIVARCDLVLERFLETQRPDDQAFQKEMLRSGLCAICASDLTTRHKATMHMLLECEYFGQRFPDHAKQARQPALHNL